MTNARTAAKSGCALPMSKEIYTCDACHYTFEAETGCDQCPDCGKKRVRPADEQESKEYLDRQKHTEKWN